jgi:hypothetical protein
VEPTDPFTSLHDAYVACGPAQYYREHGRDYRNPHEPILRELIRRTVSAWSLDLSHVLDLAAGSGEVTLALRDLSDAPPGMQIDAIDPFTGDAYAARTGSRCETFTFEAIAAGALRGRSYSLIVCSFAMHLVEESRLPALAWALAEIAPHLLILTPHKRPNLKPAWRWVLTREMLHDRVRARLYDSNG